MATHAIIAIPQCGLSVSAPESLLNFKGRFHRWDGYPNGLGDTLFKAYHKHFRRNLSLMVDYLIYQHVDWEQIVYCNLSLPARGIDVEKWVAIKRATPKNVPPVCFCHDEQGNLLYDLLDEKYWYTPANARGASWVYILASLGKEDCLGICVNLFPVISESEHMSSQYNWGWGLIGVVALRGEKPNWDAIKQERRCLREIPAFSVYGNDNGESVITKADIRDVPWLNK